MLFFKNRSFAFKLSICVLCVLLICDAIMLSLISGYFVSWIKKKEIAEFSISGNHLFHITREYCDRVEMGMRELKNQMLSNPVSSIMQFKNADYYKFTDAALQSYGESAKTIVSVRIYVINKGEYISYFDENNRIKHRFNPVMDEVPDWVFHGLNLKSRKVLGWTYLRVENDEKTRYVTTLVAPLKLHGQKNFHAVIAASSDIKKFDSQFKNATGNSIGYYLFWEEGGAIVWHPNKKIELRMTLDDVIKEYQLPKLNEVKQMIKMGHSGSIAMPRSVMYDEPVFLSFIGGKGDWVLMHIAPQDVILHPLYELRFKIVSACFILLCILILLVFWICHRGVHPLTKLSKIVKQYGDGDFSAVMPKAKTSDEIGTLINAFTIMRDKLINLIDYQRHEAAETQKRESEMLIAAEIQKSALPINFPSSSYFKITASMQPAKDVGGDFYDFFFIDKDHFAFLIADVSGKGVPAALFMMNTKALLKNVLIKGGNLAESISLANAEIVANNRANLFVTVFVAVLDIKSGVVEYVNAGHNPPLLRKKGKWEYMKGEKNLVLGCMDGVCYKSGKIIMEKDDDLFLYTDGITEAENSDLQLYGEKRLKYCLDNKYTIPEKIIETVKEDVSLFCAGTEQSDDMTMLNVYIK